MKLTYDGQEYDVPEVTQKDLERGQPYAAYYIDDDPTAKIHDFVDRFGYMPERTLQLVLPWTTLLLLGPVVEKIEPLTGREEMPLSGPFWSLGYSSVRGNDDPLMEGVPV